ncbi:MAG: hypothetical protein J3Q66DRAFT_404442 [Benniella sp.]|nr:MAG: hypothetical protein J3Q66DRAFT_404442 [Benniella sp.]
MVQEDYLGEIQRLRLREDGHDMGQHIQAPSSLFSPLTKFGSWIQELPTVETLERAFRYPTLAGQINSFSVDELLLQFLKRCSSDVRVACISTFLNVDPNSDLRRAIVDFTLPTLHRLCIRFTFQTPYPGLSKLMKLLDQYQKILVVGLQEM